MMIIRTQMDYSDLVAAIKAKHEEMKKLCES